MKLKECLKIATGVIVALILCLTFFPSSVFALENNTKIISDKIALSHEKVVFIPNYTSMKVYLTTDYLQSTNGNTCGATAATNILSYYKNARGLNLYADDMSQSIFNQICIDCKYSQNGGGPGYNKVSKGIKKFASRAGFTCVVNTYWLRLFSDVKRDINKGYPILMTYNNHAYVIVGYSEGGPYGNLIYTISAWPNQTFTWIDYKIINDGFMGSINIY